MPHLNLEDFAHEYASRHGISYAEAYSIVCSRYEEDHTLQRRIPLGETPEGKPVVWEILDEFPHLIVDGPERSGKTWMVTHVGAQALARGWTLYLCDPISADDSPLAPYARAVATNMSEVGMLFEHVTRDATKSSPAVIIIDNALAFLTESAGGRGPAWESRIKAREILFEVLRDGPSRGIQVVFCDRARVDQTPDIEDPSGFTSVASRIRMTGQPGTFYVNTPGAGVNVVARSADTLDSVTEPLRHVVRPTQINFRAAEDVLTEVTSNMTPLSTLSLHRPACGNILPAETAAEIRAFARARDPLLGEVAALWTDGVTVPALVAERLGITETIARRSLAGVRAIARRFGDSSPVLFRSC